VAAIGAGSSTDLERARDTGLALAVHDLVALVEGSGPAQ